MRARSFGIIFTSVVSMATIYYGTTATAQNLDGDSTEALAKTQELLNDRQKIKSETANNPKAKQVDENVQFLMGSEEDTAAVYKLASEIFGDMAKTSGGDGDAMMKLLEQAQKDPAAFAKKFSPEQLAKLKELAGKAEGRSPANGARK